MIDGAEEPTPLKLTPLERIYNLLVDLSVEVSRLTTVVNQLVTNHSDIVKFNEGTRKWERDPLHPYKER